MNAPPPAAEVLAWAAAFVFVVGLGAAVKRWRGAGWGPGERSSPLARLPHVLGALGAALLNPRMRLAGRPRWVAHQALVAGLLLLLVCSAVAGFGRLVARPVLGEAHPLVLALTNRDSPALAAANDLGGLLAVAGVAGLAWQRWAGRRARRPGWKAADGLLVLLGVVLVTGFLTEAIRLQGSGFHAAGGRAALVGWGVARVLDGLVGPIPESQRLQLYQGVYLLHAVLAASLIACVPFTLLAHSLAAPFTVARSVAAPGAAQAERAQVLGRAAGDALPPVYELFLDACSGCEDCGRVCPVWLDVGQRSRTGSAAAPSLPGRHPVHKLDALRAARGPVRRRPRAPGLDSLFLCTLCGRCGNVCPSGIDTRGLWLAGRRLAAREGRGVPAVLRELRETILRCGNAAGEENGLREGWQPEDGEATETEPAGADVVYFVGCTTSFYPSVYRVARDFLAICRWGGLKVAVLGPEERCCGYPLVAAGYPQDARDLAVHNIGAVNRLRPQCLVTTCPACLEAWRFIYPAITGQALPFPVLHAVEFLDGWLRDERLALETSHRVVAYHDPCDLGRGMGIYEAPRRLLARLPGVRLVELEETRSDSRCCGGGGHLARTHPELSNRLADERLSQAMRTGADSLVTACPQCIRTLTAAASRAGGSPTVVDIVSLVRQHLPAVRLR